MAKCSKPCEIFLRDKAGRFLPTNGNQRYKRKVHKGTNMNYHRWLYEEVYGELPDGFVVHHINGDKKDNRLENLKAVTQAEHNRIHAHEPWNKGKKCPQMSNCRKGAIVSDTQKRKCRQTWKNKYIESMREIYSLWMKGFSYPKIARIVGISTHCVSWRCRKYRNDYIQEDIETGKMVEQKRMKNVSKEELGFMKKVDKMRENGMTWKNIEKEISIPLSTARCKHKKYVSEFKGKCLRETEIFSRVVGYMRPIQNWNLGKKQEFKDRKTYRVQV